MEKSDILHCGRCGLEFAADESVDPDLRGEIATCPRCGCETRPYGG